MNGHLFRERTRRSRLNLSTASPAKPVAATTSNSKGTYVDGAFFTESRTHADGSHTEASVVRDPAPNSVFVQLKHKGRQPHGGPGIDPPSANRRRLTGAETQSGRYDRDNMIGDAC